MSKQKRRHHTAVRRHLVDKVPVSDLCDELGIQPSLFYVWQRQLMDNLGGFFDESRGGRIPTEHKTAWRSGSRTRERARRPDTMSPRASPSSRSPP